MQDFEEGAMKRGRPPGTPDNRWLVPEALESAGAVFQLLGDRFRPLDRELAEACRRANLGFWQAAGDLRAEMTDR